MQVVQESTGAVGTIKKDLEDGTVDVSLSSDGSVVNIPLSDLHLEDQVTQNGYMLQYLILTTCLPRCLTRLSDGKSSMLCVN